MVKHERQVERPFAPAPAVLDLRRAGGSGGGGGSGGPAIPATWARQWWALPVMLRFWVLGFRVRHPKSLLYITYHYIYIT